MPALKPGTIWPTPEEEAQINAGILLDPDNPELTDEDFARMRPAREVLPPEVYAALTDKSTPVVFRHVTDAEHAARVETIRRRGRPKSAAPKEKINVRLSPHVLTALRATGKGWQTRIDALLCEAVAQGRV